MILRFSGLSEDIKINEHRLNILKFKNKDQKFSVIKALGKIDESHDDISLFTDTYDYLNATDKILFTGDPIANDYFFENICT